MTARFHFGTNLKMHTAAPETRAFVTALAAQTVDAGVRRFVIPPYTSLQGLAAIGAPAGIEIGAQNAHFAASGAYTGEISVGMLAALDVDLIMIGHAERRALPTETDDVIARKVAAVLGGTPDLLLCVGERMAERRALEFTDVLRRQLISALGSVRPEQLSRVQVAYEPVWSIGESGVAAEPEDITPAIATIRSVLAELFGKAARAVPLLYGGSVNRDNCADYAVLGGIDGLFVGRAAWSADGFGAVLARGHEAWKLRGGDTVEAGGSDADRAGM